MNRIELYAIVLVMFANLNYCAVEQQATEYAGIQLVKEITIESPSAGVCGNNMDILPEGTIWINTTTMKPGVYQSSDRAG